jgi:hypothetical protein
VLQAVFKKRVVNDQLGEAFQGPHDLAVQFLVDLFKQAKGPLFAKMRPQLGNIPFDTLHAVTTGLLPGQIKSVGGEKYIPGVYVARSAEVRAREFIEFQDRFDARSQDLLSLLEDAVKTYAIAKKVAPILSEARSILSGSQGPRNSISAVNALKEACHFEKIEGHLAAIGEITRASNAFRSRRLSRELLTSLSGRPYVDTSRLSDLPALLDLVLQRVASGGTASQEMMDGLRSLFPSTLHSEQILLANDILKELALLVEQSSKRCIALVDRAGRGKTNVICKIAEQSVERHAVILLSGRMTISHEYQIEWHIQHQLEGAFGAAFADWISRSAPALERERQWIFVIVDGINESADLSLLIKVLEDFLPKLEGQRIKLIVSCRDIYWDLFLPVLKPYLFEEAISLGEYSETEWNRATDLYFDRYHVSAEIRGKAEVSLRNPLLLRFFCEAYQGENLGAVSEIHLLAVFRLYVDRVGRNIAERKGLLRKDVVAKLLEQVVACMWYERSPVIDQSRLKLTLEDLSSSESIYNLVRSENIVLDESLHVETTIRQVRFVYDEFMEYMLARYWLDLVVGAAAQHDELDKLVRQAMEAILDFPSTMGAVIFLDEMLSRNGSVVSRALVLAKAVREELIRSRQTTLLLALESIDVAAPADDELLQIVDAFELVAASELRSRLARVILQLLEHNGENRGLRSVISRLLDVHSDNETSTSESGVHSPQGGTEEREMVEDVTAEHGVVQAHAEERGDQESVPTLPAARYHYSEEDKINAISLIVASRNPGDYALVESGIRRLGGIDLHSALDALASVDLADDEFVYKTIERHMKGNSCEYRIYCAWLLRQRYGQEPSRFLLKLLSAEETRVHRYAFSLFETRRVEKVLLEGILIELDRLDQIKPWHLVYRTKLLGRRLSFAPRDLGEQRGEAIVNKLRAITRHTLPNIRLAAYRSLEEYPEFVAPSNLTEWMRGDIDPYIQSLVSGPIQRST